MERKKLARCRNKPPNNEKRLLKVPSPAKVSELSQALLSRCNHPAGQTRQGVVAFYYQRITGRAQGCPYRGWERDIPQAVGCPFFFAQNDESPMGGTMRLSKTSTFNRRVRTGRSEMDVYVQSTPQKHKSQAIFSTKRDTGRTFFLRPSTNED